MLTAEQYARAKELMCKNYPVCTKCPLYGHNDDEFFGERISCQKFVVKYPAEAVKLVHLWWLENKHRFPEYCRCEGDEEK